jgi:hypothetical protein
MPRAPWGRGASPKALVALALAALLAASLAPATKAQAPATQARATQQAGPSLVVLVRHAEKAEDPADDPPLSAVGEERARELARTLADAGITRIHSTDTRRTMDTVRPLAEALGLEIERYDSRDLDGMATRLRTLPGRHLVVGHSNTTDVLSGRLGGATFGEIDEPWEYDRLYFLTPRPHLPGTAPGSAGFETVLVRFGARVSPGG